MENNNSRKPFILLPSQDNYFEELTHRREMKQMEKRITENVMHNIDVELDAKVFNKLRDMLKDLCN